MSENNGGFTELLGVKVSSAEEGRAVVSLQAEEHHLNPSGTVHGGVVYTLIDICMAQALNTMTEEDDQPFVTEIKVNYMEPGKPGMLASTTQVRKSGKRGTIEAEVVQEEDGDEVIALATGTYTPVG